MALCIEFKHQGETRTATILKNRGIAWFVKDMAGDEYLVQKKHVVRQWDEPDPAACSGCGTITELNEEGFCPACQAAADTASSQAPANSILGQLNTATHSEPVTPKAKKSHSNSEPKPRDPNLVTLKEICFELEVEPRIARRNLRKGVGNIGTGSRWEWAKGSDDLAKVRKILLKAE